MSRVRVGPTTLLYSTHLIHCLLIFSNDLDSWVLLVDNLFLSFLDHSLETWIEIDNLVVPRFVSPFSLLSKFVEKHRWI
jgi:hypothetical protein